MSVLVTTSQLYRIPCFRGLFEYHPVFTDRWRVHAPVYLHRCTWCSAMLTGQRKMNKLLPVMGHETSDGEKEESMWLPRILDKAGMTKSLCLFLPRTLDSCYVALEVNTAVLHLQTSRLWNSLHHSWSIYYILHLAIYLGISLIWTGSLFIFSALFFVVIVEER